MYPLCVDIPASACCIVVHTALTALAVETHEKIGTWKSTVQAVLWSTVVLTALIILSQQGHCSGLEQTSQMHRSTVKSNRTCRSGDDDGFPGVDYNDVYKMKNTYAEDDMSEDLPEAEIASIGSISIADAEVEMADCDAASEDSVF